MRKSSIILISVGIIFGLILALPQVTPLIFPKQPQDVTIAEIISNPWSFDDNYVRVQGYVADSGKIWPSVRLYVLRELDGDEIALGTGAMSSGGLVPAPLPGEVAFGPYVSFVHEGGKYTQVRNVSVIVVGYVHYTPYITDNPHLSISVEKIEVPSAALMGIQVQLLKESVPPSNAYNNRSLRFSMPPNSEDSFEIDVMNYGAIPLHNVTIEVEQISENLALMISNRRAQPSDILTLGTISVKDGMSYGWPIHSPPLLGDYEIIFHITSSEEECRFKATINVS